MKVITLSREYGAGGHSIGREVAKKLGIEIYDKDIIKGVALEMGVDPDLIEAEGEEISRADSFIRSITPISYDQKETMYEIEKKIIIDIAKKGPCLILGRCANIILQEAGIDSLDVHVYSNDVHRAARVSELIGSTNPSEINKVMKKKDHDRHAYYTYHTGHHWGDQKDYNLMIDSGELGYEKAIELICMAVK